MSWNVCATSNSSSHTQCYLFLVLCLLDVFNRFNKLTLHPHNEVICVDFCCHKVDITVRNKLHNEQLLKPIS